MKKGSTIVIREVQNGISLYPKDTNSHWDEETVVFASQEAFLLWIKEHFCRFEKPRWDKR